jgi:hypothetical protein
VTNARDQHRQLEREGTAVTHQGKDKAEERQELSPELKAIEAQLWAEASPHQRVAAQIIGRATD